MTDWKAPARATASPMIVCDRAMEVIAFIKTVFGGELLRAPLMRADGGLWNAEVRIGESTIMLAEAQGDFKFPGFVYVHVPDADATYQKALDAGAEPFMPVADRFYGDRDGGVRDMAGNLWWIGTHQKDLSDSEIEAGARAQEADEAAG